MLPVDTLEPSHSGSTLIEVVSNGYKDTHCARYSDLVIPRGVRSLIILAFGEMYVSFCRWSLLLYCYCFALISAGLCTRGGGVSDSVSFCLSVVACDWKGIPTVYESGRLCA